MGSYCELYISDYPIATTKNEIDPFLLSIFQPKDLITFNRKVGERYQLLYGREEESEDDELAIQYVNTTQNIKDRLEVMGFTIEKSKITFETSKNETLQTLKEWENDKIFNDSDEANESLKNEINILENSTFEDFIEAVKVIFEKKLGYWTKKESLPKDTNPIIFYLLDTDYGLERFPYNNDQRFLLRALIEATSLNSLITYDVTDLIEGGYYTDEPEFIYEEVIENITYNYDIGEKFLILTEGTSDINILRNSMKLLYPHLSDYYSFMDFGVSNASGSASSLVASIKSFVGAGIKNKIIALFDNDTAAESALRGLKETKTPSNIKILQYPQLQIAENYPTIGPTGITNMDINGLAGSIEIYLGEDVLKLENKLIPIQWKGYDSALKKYQGEIINKDLVQKRFEKKVKECNADISMLSKYDWTGLDSILKMIFNSFN